MRALYTIGHSTRSSDEFAAILQGFGIETLVDIRTVPGSRRNPQYSQSEMPKWLADAGIEYLHCRDLGGLRKPRKDSTNIAWRNDSFRGYADYMQTPPFEAAIEWLIALATQKKVAIMCAEAVPWRCHRSLVADALTARGVEVQHIMGPRSAKPHAVTAWARVEGTQVTYPGIF